MYAIAENAHMLLLRAGVCGGGDVVVGMVSSCDYSLAGSMRMGCGCGCVFGFGEFYV